MPNFLELYNPHEVTSRYLAIMPKNDDEAAALFTAMNNPNKNISDCINQEINIYNVYIQSVEVEDNITNEIKLLPRTVIIDENGVSYSCTSGGLFNALEKLFSIYGTPDKWKAPITVKIIQVKVNRGSMLSFDLVTANGNLPTL